MDFFRLVGNIWLAAIVFGSGAKTVQLVYLIKSCNATMKEHFRATLENRKKYHQLNEVKVSEIKVFMD